VVPNVRFWGKADIALTCRYVRFWHKADLGQEPIKVCFWLDSRHRSRLALAPECRNRSSELILLEKKMGRVGAVGQGR
jgi:hypothetical protein